MQMSKDRTWLPTQEDYTVTYPERITYTIDRPRSSKALPSDAYGERSATGPFKVLIIHTSNDRSQQRSFWESRNQPINTYLKQKSAGTGFCVGKAVSLHIPLPTFATHISLRKPATSYILQCFMPMLCDPTACLHCVVYVQGTTARGQPYL